MGFLTILAPESKAEYILKLCKDSTGHDVACKKEGDNFWNIFKVIGYDIELQKAFGGPDGSGDTGKAKAEAICNSITTQRYWIYQNTVFRVRGCQNPLTVVGRISSNKGYPTIVTVEKVGPLRPGLTIDGEVDCNMACSSHPALGAACRQFKTNMGCPKE